MFECLYDDFHMCLYVLGSLNPTFCNHTFIYIPYCDGNSFTGNRNDPVEVAGKSIYFRGRRILDEIFKELQSTYGLFNADEVLLTGTSAGNPDSPDHPDHPDHHDNPRWSCCVSSC